MTRLVILADAGPAVGSGHVMRTLALAQAWQAGGGHVTYAVPQAGAALVAAVREAACEVVPIPGSDPLATAREVVSLVRSLRAAALVVDHYGLGTEAQRLLRTAAVRTLWLDDVAHHATYVTDLLLNAACDEESGAQDLSARYRESAPDATLLAGPRFALIRREFRPWRERRTTSPSVATPPRIVVTFGGSERGAELMTTVQQAIAAVMPTVRINPPTASWPEALGRADLAIVPAGQTAWEALFLGLPTIVVQTADNQTTVAAWCKSRHAALDLLTWTGPETARLIAQAAQAAMPSSSTPDATAPRAISRIDGYGADRAVMHLQEAPIWLRPWEWADARPLWEWANDPTTRAASFSTDPIPWETHCDWFRKKLADPACRGYIAVDRHEQPVGQWRVDLEGRRGIVSVGLAPTARGRRFGREVIVRGTARVRAETNVGELIALVRPENAASVRAFLGAGYREAAPQQIRQTPARCFICSD